MLAWGPVIGSTGTHGERIQDRKAKLGSAGGPQEPGNRVPIRSTARSRLMAGERGSLVDNRRYSSLVRAARPHRQETIEPQRVAFSWNGGTDTGAAIGHLRWSRRALIERAWEGGSLWGDDAGPDQLVDGTYDWKSFS